MIHSRNDQQLLAILTTARLLLVVALSTTLFIHFSTLLQLNKLISFSKLALIRLNLYFVLSGMLQPIVFSLMIALHLSEVSFTSLLLLINNLLLILTLSSLNSLGGMADWRLHTQLARTSIGFFIIYQLVEGLAESYKVLTIKVLILCSLLASIKLRGDQYLGQHILIFLIQLRIYLFRGGIKSKNILYISRPKTSKEMSEVQLK